MPPLRSINLCNMCHFLYFLVFITTLPGGASCPRKQSLLSRNSLPSSVTCMIRLYSNVLSPCSYITMVQSGACGVPYSFVILDRKGWICNREVPKVDIKAAVIVCNNFGITVLVLNYIGKKAK